jgi:hypothetical protein
MDQPQTKQEFRDWLKSAMDRIDAVYANEYPDETDWQGCATVAVAAGDISARLGMPELHQRSRDFAGFAEPQAVKTFLADCLAACIAKPVNTTPPRYLTVKRAANHCDLSESSIRRELSKGKLTALRPVKGRVLIDRLELENLIRSSDFRPRTGRGIR